MVGKKYRNLRYFRSVFNSSIAKCDKEIACVCSLKNKLRLIAFVRYRTQKLYIKDVLDHREYDRGKWKEGKQ
ncbi:TPA: type II toxin-antitoxin system HigB family toxin [Pseudomonas putida]|nr:type II toxin-antitoxin system HigB family toxin [Pseudomonas putida]